jgi:hypothetical protein
VLKPQSFMQAPCLDTLFFYAAYKKNSIFHIGSSRFFFSTILNQSGNHFLITALKTYFNPLSNKA